MKLIKTAKFVKSDVEVLNTLIDSITKNFCGKKTKKDKEIHKAISEERYEDAAKIRDSYMEEDQELVSNLANDINNEIDKLGVPYRFENIRADGIAINGYCVIANSVLNYDADQLAFTMFHELAHFYQYKKYGDTSAESIYTNDESKVDEDVERLLKIENTADRFASSKTKFYFNKYGLDCNIRMPYKNISKEFIRSHVLQMKKMVAKMPPAKRNIRDINEYLYNSIKIKPIVK